MITKFKIFEYNSIFNKLEFIERKNKIGWIYRNGVDTDIICDLNLNTKKGYATIEGYDILPLGKGLGEDFIQFLLEFLEKNYNIKYLVSIKSGRNNYSEQLWNKLKNNDKFNVVFSNDEWWKDYSVVSLYEIGENFEL